MFALKEQSSFSHTGNWWGCGIIPTFSLSRQLPETRITTHKSPLWNITIMRPVSLVCLLAALMIALLCCAGCTTQQAPGAVAGTPQVSPGTPSLSSAVSPAGTPAVKSSGVDTTINVHFNDYACIDLQKEMGTDYLYPDQKYTLRASSPGSGPVNVNVLLLDVNDNLKIRQIKPSWDTVKKSWVYDGLVPLVQFNDLTTAQQKTITIKNQGMYYLCVDDRKETGTGDTLYQVPVSFTKVN